MTKESAIGAWRVKLKFLKLKIATAAILKIVMLAMSHQPIVGFQRNFFVRK